MKTPRCAQKTNGHSLPVDIGVMQAYLRKFGAYLLRGITVALVCFYWPLTAMSWPNKPIHVIVPYSAGGGADTVMRILAPHISSTLGQPVMVDNQPGAGGTIGAGQVAKAPADGYTVLYDASAFAVNPGLRKIPYDAANDFIPVALVVTAPQIFVVSANAPYRTFVEFVEHARNHPDALSFASAGAGTGSHLAAEALMQQASVRLLHVPYKGGAQALADVIGGQVSAYFGNVASTSAHVRSGKLRALAVSSAKRIASLPEVPTLQEMGLANYNVVEWNGVFLPKSVPDEVVERLGVAVRAAITAPDIHRRLTDMGLEPADTSPQVFARFVQAEIRRVDALLKASNIKLE